jgi:single-strand DNA-binding protein
VNRHAFGTDASQLSSYVAFQDDKEDDVNVVTLIGNLATDVELKELAEGKRVASFVLAVDRAGKEGGADFVRVSAWDRQAELCSQFLHKGDRAALDGRLRSRSWQAPDGTRRSAVEVVANRVQFLTPPGAGERAAASGTPFEEAAVS